jgi:hypothetical protein
MSALATRMVVEQGYRVFIIGVVRKHGVATYQLGTHLHAFAATFHTPIDFLAFSQGRSLSKVRRKPLERGELTWTPKHTVALTLWILTRGAIVGHGQAYH